MASPIKSTTQQQIDIEDVLDDLVLQKDGSCSLILKANAINFGLLSEEEQDATIYAYAAFLNSLTFSIQILIRSDMKDISGYIKQLEEQEVKQSNQTKKQQIHNYKNFISTLITERNVLEKSFYIVIPFSTLELGISQSFSASFLKKKSTLPFEKSYIIEKAKANLEPKRDHVLRQLARIGLGARQLSTQELIQLLFSMYNASSTQGQKITNTSDYTVPLVQPAYIKPKEDTMSDNNTTAPPVVEAPTPQPTVNTPPTNSAQTTGPQTPAATSNTPTPTQPPTETIAQSTPQPTTTPPANSPTPPVSPDPSTTPSPAASTAQPVSPPALSSVQPAAVTNQPNVSSPNTQPTTQPTAQPVAPQTPPVPTPPPVQPGNTSTGIAEVPSIQTPSQPVPPQTQPSPAQPASQPPSNNLADAQSLINSAANDLTGSSSNS